ncbi:MAG: LysR substrate-binding domain-containing protein [Burkholderiales bacterium]
MRLNQIRVFLAIIDSGSIHAAARQLGVTQPAITKGLRQLEESLHVRLLDRTPHGVVPTLAGRAFIARARAVQSELRKAEEDLAQLAGERAGSVAFGFSLVGLQIVTEAFSRFREHFPDARVRIVESVSHRLLPMVRDESLDFVVGRWTGGKSDSSISARPLLSCDMVVAGRTGHPRGKMRSLAQLLDAEWVLVVPPGSPGSMVERLFVSAGLRVPEKLTQCESFAALLLLLAETDFLAVLPQSLLATPFGRVGLQPLAIQEPLPRETISLITRADARLTPLAADMVKAVTTAAKQLARSAKSA